MSSIIYRLYDTGEGGGGDADIPRYCFWFMIERNNYGKQNNKKYL